jgi:tRNA nucleotidyltransferase (CCA-adding enzyme)
MTRPTDSICDLVNKGLPICYNYNELREAAMTTSRPINLDLSIRLEQVLTPEQVWLLRSVAEQAARQQLPLYIVGGFVRDLLLGHPGMDFDLVVEGDAIGLARAVAARQGGKVTVHTRFKTAQWFPPPGHGIPDFVDFSSTRAEIYKHPAALPTVRSGTLADDLHRRDFTLNTLALRLDGDHFGELIDEVGGLEDLQAGIIKALHSHSLEDDPTRLFRMIRYEERYGFKIASETLSLVPGGLQQVNRLSAERVRHELDLILEEEKAASIMRRLAKLGILAAVHPALEWNQATHKRFVKGLSAVHTLERQPSRGMLAWSLWLMGTPTHSLVSIEKRLHFDSGLRKMLQAATALFADVDSLIWKKPSLCVAVLDKIPLKSVQAVFLGSPAGPTRQILRNYLETWRVIKPRTTGHDLKKRGLPPGPDYKTLLHKLRAAWLDGEVKTVEEEIAMLDKLSRPILK